MQFYRQNVNLLLPSWLRKIGDAYLVQASKIYRANDIPFETSWFPVFLVLSKHPSATISEIAEILEVTQPSVSQVTSALERKGLVNFNTSKTDGRKKMVSLSEEGQRMVLRLQPLWNSIDRAMSQMLFTHEKTRNLAETLSIIEKLINLELHREVQSILADRPVNIRQIKSTENIDLYLQFKKNEGIDFIFPEKACKVYAAFSDQEVIGAVAVEKQSPSEFILYNLYVCRGYRLRGIAKGLLARAIPQDSKTCIIMDRATPELVDLLLKCSYSFKVEVNTD